MFTSEDLERLQMGNPWKRWNQRLGFRKLDEPVKEEDEPEPEIKPAPSRESETAPLLVRNSLQPSASAPSAPDLISGPDPAPAPMSRTRSGNPFDTHSEMPTATPMSRHPGYAPYYTVRFSGGAAPQIQLPPVPPPYGHQGPPSAPGGPPGGEYPPGGGPQGIAGQDGDGSNDGDKNDDTVVEVEPDPRERSAVKDTPFFVTMLFAVTILVLFIHLPLGIMIGNYMRSISVVIMVGPLGGILGLMAVYITPCECVATREQAVGRIRYLGMTAIILDLVGAVVMPLSVYSMECPGRDGEPYNNSCQFMRIPAQGVGMAAALSTAIHLFLMIIVRGSADKLALLVTEFDEEEEDENSDSDSDSDSEDEEERRRREEKEKEREKKRKAKEKAKKAKEKEKAKNAKNKKK
ncbi:hypothetical protein BSKO_08979 [Bryopsis sp. KO-2023]|nr:hypothetical protein BSKO_08979 [Bryopsis sp. KO-2023]